MRVYIVRHGQSANNANPDTQVVDPDLTEIGRKQALLTAKALLEENLAGARLYISPMRRTLQTAEPIGKLLDLKGYVRPDICEAGGLWDSCGMGANEILQEWPHVDLHRDIGEDGWWIWGCLTDQIPNDCLG